MNDEAKKTNMEKKRERFVKIAEQRTNKIIDMMRLLGNCANKSNYEYSDEDVKKIFTAIDAEYKTLKSKFVEAGAGTDKKFTLR